MPNAEGLVGRHHHFRFDDAAFARHRPVRDANLPGRHGGVQRRGIGPAAPYGPERSLRPARFLGVEVAADARKAVKQVLDAPVLELLCQSRAVAAQGGDHRRRLQRGGQPLENAFVL